MRIKLLVLIFFYLFFGARSVLAIDPPSLLNPQNNATVSSSRLEWQAPSYQIYTQGYPYVVQIKNTPTFTSADDRYKTNTYYTPELSEGTWYWRIKAKNNEGIWSEWSPTQSFNLVTSTPSPTPAPTPSPTPTPTPSPTPTPIPSPATLPSPTPSAKPTIFTISNSPSEINENQSFSVSVNLSLPDNPNTKFYIKGAFKKSGSSNYFGNTKVSGNWIKNGGSYSGQFPITTDSSGKWNGSIELMPDSEDTGFSGTSDYILKIGRYTDLGSGPIWSNEVNIKIKQIEINQDFPVNTSSPAATPSIEENLSDDEEKDNNTSIYNPKTYNIKIASIAGISSSSAQEIKEDQTFRNNKKGNNFLIFTGGAITVSSATFLGYLLLKSKGLV